MKGYLLFDNVSLFLGIWVILLFSGCGVRFILQSMNKETKSKRLLLLSNGFLFFGLALMRIFMLIGQYQLEGQYIQHSYYIESYLMSKTYLFFIQVGYIIFMASIGIYLFLFDYALTKTKYILFAINLLSIFILFITFSRFNLLIFYIVSGINASILLLILIWFSKNTSKQIQSVYSLFLLGFTLIVIGFLFDAPFMKEFEFLHPSVPSLFLITGGLITIAPTILNPQIISGGKFKWIIFSILGLFFISISLYLLFIEMDFLFLDLLFWITFLNGISLFSYVSIYLINESYLKVSNLRKDIQKKKELKDKKKEDYLRIFMKPQKIFKEEISSAREKNICIVCKNQLKGNIYVCPKCGAIYCIKCAQFISNRENVCWACSTPIDKSKPILLPETTLYEDLHGKEEGKITKIAFVSVIDEEVLETVNLFEWKKQDKEDFIKYIAFLSSERREEILQEMLEASAHKSSMNQKQKGKR